MKIYLVNVVDHTSGAKNKGIIQNSNYKSRYGAATTYAINANNTEEAYAKLCKFHNPQDNRPLAGKSYMRPVKVGRQVSIPKGYFIGYEESGFEKRATTGVVSELIGDNCLSIHPTGYFNKFVDFGLSELVDHRIM